MPKEMPWRSLLKNHGGHGHTKNEENDGKMMMNPKIVGFSLFFEDPNSLLE